MGIVMWKLMFGQLADITWKDADVAVKKGTRADVSEELKHLVKFMV
jgi:hypothetical protein